MISSWNKESGTAASSVVSGSPAMNADSKCWYISDNNMYMFSFGTFTCLHTYLNVVVGQLSSMPHPQSFGLLCTFHRIVMAWWALTWQSATTPVAMLAKLVLSGWKGAVLRKECELMQGCGHWKLCLYAAHTRCLFASESVCVVHENTVLYYVLKEATSNGLSLYESLISLPPVFPDLIKHFSIVMSAQFHSRTWHCFFQIIKRPLLNCCCKDWHKDLWKSYRYRRHDLVKSLWTEAARNCNILYVASRCKPQLPVLSWQLS